MVEARLIEIIQSPGSASRSDLEAIVKLASSYTYCSSFATLQLLLTALIEERNYEQEYKKLFIYLSDKAAFLEKLEKTLENHLEEQANQKVEETVIPAPHVEEEKHIEQTIEVTPAAPELTVSKDKDEESEIKEEVSESQEIEEHKSTSEIVEETFLEHISKRPATTKEVIETAQEDSHSVVEKILKRQEEEEKAKKKKKKDKKEKKAKKKEKKKHKEQEQKELISNEQTEEFLKFTPLEEEIAAVKEIDPNPHEHKEQSFLDWLRSNQQFKEVPKKKEDIKRTKANDLIDKFLATDPKMSKPNKNLTFEQPKEVKESVSDNLMMVSETLALIYVQQENFHKAIEAYRQLMVKNPEKKSFFANQIKQIEELILKRE